MTIQIPQRSTPPVLPRSDEAIDQPGSANLVDAPAQVSGTDPLAQFGSMNGFHPQVQAVAYSSPGGGSGGTKAAAVYDVAKTPQAEIDRLKRSADPVERKIGTIIENAKVAYGDLLAKGARIVVTTSQGNGGDPVLTLTGPKFNPKLPAHVHTHYHGDNATVADPIGSKAGTNVRIREAVARDPQMVFVLPESREATKQPSKIAHQAVDTPSSNSKYYASWQHVASQAQTTDDALKAAGVTKVGHEVVSVHSRGGSVISRLMDQDPSGKLLRANRLEMYDSLYGSQWDVAKWAKTPNGKAVERVIYYHGTNDAGAEAPVKQAFRDKFTQINAVTPKNEDAVNPIYRDAQGNTFMRPDWKGRMHPVRIFEADAHYRTTGQYLGTEPPALPKKANLAHERAHVQDASAKLKHEAPHQPVKR